MKIWNAGRGFAHDFIFSLGIVTFTAPIAIESCRSMILLCILDYCDGSLWNVETA